MYPVEKIIKNMTKNRLSSNTKKMTDITVSGRSGAGRYERIEAKFGISDGKEARILGVTVSGTPKSEVLKKIVQVCEKKAFTKPLFVVTAYSEFFLEAKEDKKFAAALSAADLVLPDGVSVPAAVDYLSGTSGNRAADFLGGLKIGIKVLRGEYRNKTIVGVKLTQELLEMAAKNHWRVFMLGGYGRTSEKLTYKLRQEHPGLAVEWDEGPQDLQSLTDDKYQITKALQDKIEKFSPDLLLVALGRYKQEKWIAANLNRFEAKMVMGVGSSFDEMLGEGPWAEKPPEYVERMGIKWAWRIIRDPKHIKRAWRAFPVFAWRVFRSG